MTVDALFRQHGPDRVEWLGTDGTVREGTPHQLASAFAGRPATLVVPGEAVTLVDARVPGRRRSVWQKAAPYAVEEALAEPVESLHFAFSQRLSTGALGVAAVAHQTLRGWLAAADIAGVSPASAAADSLLLPLRDKTWSLLCEENRCLLRTGRWTGFACERDSLPVMLELALREAGENEKSAEPEAIRCWGEVPALPFAADKLDKQPARPTLAVLAEGLRQGLSIDLLQGAYQGRGRTAGSNRGRWRPAAALASLCLLVATAGQIIDYLRLARERARLNVQTEEVFRRAMPEAKRLVNPRAQLNARLQQVRSGTAEGEGEFLDLLAFGGRGLDGLATVKLRSLRFRDTRLDLLLEGRDLGDFDRLKTRLESPGEITVEMRNSKVNGAVESRISLSKG